MLQISFRVTSQLCNGRSDYATVMANMGKLIIWISQNNKMWHDIVVYEFIGEFPSQRPVTRSFDVFFDLRLNKRLSTQSRRRWFEMPSRPLWRHCDELHWRMRDPITKSYDQCRSDIRLMFDSNVSLRLQWRNVQTVIFPKWIIYDMCLYYLIDDLRYFTYHEFHFKTVWLKNDTYRSWNILFYLACVNWLYSYPRMFETHCGH